ncbi:MAG: sulfatase [Phycisphaeraceae bacterium]|nr:sulfatase [Phycisphaeraceae bacterium]
MKPLNIIYIHSHDTGRYVQPYGHDIDTPNIQKLAEQGILFRKAFCSGPTCSPSRAGLLTGQSPHSAGMLGLAHRGFALNDYKQHVGHLLRENGYTTALAGIQHIAAKPFADPQQVLPYDTFAPENAEREQWAADFIKQKHDKPFFLSVGFYETHREFPNEPDAQDVPRYCMPPTPLPDNEQTRYDMACYKSMARTLDRKMGVVFDAVKQAGLQDNTLIICTTDHGIAFPAMKCSLTDFGIGVMLIIKGPQGFTGGKVIQSMVSHIDLFPTICQLTEIDEPDYLQGKSVLPLVREEVSQINDEIFSEVTHHVAYEPKRCVRTQRYKYIRLFDDFSTTVMSNCDNSISKTHWANFQWAHRNVPQEQLYDLEFDPNERVNLVERDDMQDVRVDMRKRLENWMQRTCDPLLQGPVKVPAGGADTPQHMYSPDGKK